MEVFFFYPLLPNFRNSITFCKVPRLRAFVLLVTATCRWRSVLSIGGMILTEENRSTGRKTCSNASWSTTNPTWTVLGSSAGLSFSITKTKVLVLFRWRENRWEHVLCTHLALQKVTLGSVPWTVQRKVRQTSWHGGCGQCCAHWTVRYVSIQSAALPVSRAHTFVV